MAPGCGRTGKALRCRPPSRGWWGRRRPRSASTRQANWWGVCAGVRVETKQVERTTEALGRRVADDERTVTEPAPAPAPTMRWTVAGANAIIALRGCRLGGRRFEDFWEQRATRAACTAPAGSSRGLTPLPRCW